MDLFEAGCQGLGLALASGLVFGAPGALGRTGRVLAASAAIAGAVLWGLSLSAADHPAWPGGVLGAIAGVLAYTVAGGVSSGARARAGEGGGGVAAMIALAGAALAGVALAGPAAYASIAVALALALLALTRRRKAADKHAGLRSLR